MASTAPSQGFLRTRKKTVSGLSALFLMASLGIGNDALAATGKDKPMVLDPRPINSVPRQPTPAKPICVQNATPKTAGDYRFRRLIAMKSASALAHQRREDGEPVDPVTAIAIASYETGIDFDLLVMKATLESRMGRYDQPLLGGSARGLFHFMPATWLTLFSWFGGEFEDGVYAGAARKIKFDADNEPYVDDPVLKQKILDLRSDPYVAAFIKAKQIRYDERPVLRTVLGREPTYTDYYVAHFLGLESSKTFYRNLRRNPNGSAANVLTREAGDPNNRGVFYRGNTALSFRQVYDRLGRVITRILANVDQDVQSTLRTNRCVHPLKLTPPSHDPLITPITPISDTPPENDPIPEPDIDQKEGEEELPPPPPRHTLK